MAIELTEERRRDLISRLGGFYLEEFDEELSPFRAEQLLDFVLDVLGPQVYNQAVQDARGYLQTKLDELDGEVYVPERSDA